MSTNNETEDEIQTEIARVAQITAGLLASGHYTLSKEEQPNGHAYLLAESGEYHGCALAVSDAMCIYTEIEDAVREPYILHAMAMRRAEKEERKAINDAVDKRDKEKDQPPA